VSKCLTRRRALQALGAAALNAAVMPLAQGASLAKVKERGRLIVGVYTDMPPFHVNGKGIDIDLAQALADGLGVAMSLLPFTADEKMSDDLRNMVWRGHYLGYGPADVLLHVPVDRPLIEATPQARIFAPYHRETVAIARDVAKLPRLEALSALTGQRVAVPGQSLAGWLLIGADGGAYREMLSTQWKDGTEAARALQRGEFSAAAGERSELESTLGQDPRFAIEPLPSPRAPSDGWAVGIAVKAGADDLALALQMAMNSLADTGRLDQIFMRGGVHRRAG
jgi:ABC-type amino acid transport substrate-binding protein